jgi:hypothetical protein
MPPIDFFNVSLMRCALCKYQSSTGSLLRCFGTGEHKSQRYECSSQHTHDARARKTSYIGSAYEQGSAITVFFVPNLYQCADKCQVTIAQIFLNSEAFAARAVGDRVRVRDFESTFLQILAVVEHRAADKKRALRIDD